MPKMQTSFTGLVTLLAKNLYTSAEVFIRELIQNAHDGCQRRKAVEPRHNPRIDITTSPTDRTISFADNGIGMDENEIHSYLSTIGRSGTATETARMSTAGMTAETIGQFGVGLLSAFVVAERIDVFTRKPGQDTGYHWISHGGEEYTVEPSADAPEGGTDITLTLKPAFAHHLREKELVRAIQLFAELLSVPIYVNGNGPVNARVAPWDGMTGLTPEQREQEGRSFLERRYRDQPLLLIPIDIPAPRARGLLYITDQPMPGIGSSGQVDIYVRRICIRLNDGELLPEWATFVRGVIDADLQPTASRDTLQRDLAYHELRRELGTAIVRALLALQASDPDHFVKLCNWHEAGIKGMALHHDEFFGAVAARLPFRTNDGVLPLADFIARQAPLPSGRKPLYYFSFDGDETQFFQLCSANRLLAINAGRLFDEPVLRKYARRHEAELELRRLDHLNSQQIYHVPPATTAAAFTPLVEAVTAAVSSQGWNNVRVAARSFAPEELAAVLIDQPGAEAFDRFKLLCESPLIGPGLQSLAVEIAEKTRHKPMELLLNVRNPLVQSLQVMAGHCSTEGQELSAGLFHLALLSSQRRVKAENARQITEYLQARLDEIIRLRRALAAATEKRMAWQRCIEVPRQAAAADWAAVTRDLVGCTPEEFRTRVSAATDEGVGELLLHLYRQMKQA